MIETNRISTTYKKISFSLQRFRPYFVIDTSTCSHDLITQGMRKNPTPWS